LTKYLFSLGGSFPAAITICSVCKIPTIEQSGICQTCQANVFAQAQADDADDAKEGTMMVKTEHAEKSPSLDGQRGRKEKERRFLE